MTSYFLEVLLAAILERGGGGQMPEPVILLSSLEFSFQQRYEIPLEVSGLELSELMGRISRNHLQSHTIDIN